MADRPIHFSAPMVRALLDGRKTQTRMVLTPRPGAQARWLSAELLHSSPSCYLATVDGQLGAQMQHPLAGSMRNGIANDAMSPLTWIRLPYAPGDRLWVREAWRTTPAYDDLSPAEMGGEEPVKYEADGSEQMWGWPDRFIPGRFRHASFMPRWASRLTLTVTDVRVQRLQEITLGDICAEGLAQSIYDFRPVQRGFDAFAALWNSLHGPGAWDANPWVCALTFSVHRCNIDQMEADHG